MRTSTTLLFLSLAPAAHAADLLVTSFGATPGDGGDDRAAIQAAINAAGPGDRVLVPAGTFDIAGSLSMKSGVTLAGTSAADSLLRRDNSGTNAPIIELRNLSNAAISNLSISGNLDPRATHGIVAQNAANLAITGVRIRDLTARADDAGQHGIYFSSGVTASRIEGCSIANIGVNSEWGAGIKLDHQSHGNTVANNTVATTGRGGIHLKLSTDARILGNTVTGSGSFAGAPPLGIELFESCDRGVVEGNTVDHWLSVDRSSRVAVRRNTVSDTWSSTSQIGAYGLELANGAGDVVFTGNQVKGGQHIGFSMSGPRQRSRVLVARNTIDDMETWAMQLQAEDSATLGDGTNSRLVFVDNTFTDTRDKNGLYSGAGHALRLNADNGKIIDTLFRNNTVTGNAGKAFDRLVGSGTVAEKLAGLRVQGSTVSGNGDNTVPASAAYATADPTATLIAPLQIVAGQPAAFDVSLLLAGVTPAAPDAVLWDFDHGVPEVGAAQLHAFPEAGEYRVTVVAWAADGRAAVAERVVTVVPVPEPAAAAMAATLLMTLAMRGR